MVKTLRSLGDSVGVSQQNSEPFEIIYPYLLKHSFMVFKIGASSLDRNLNSIPYRQQNSSDVTVTL